MKKIIIWWDGSPRIILEISISLVYKVNSAKDSLLVRFLPLVPLNVKKASNYIYGFEDRTQKSSERNLWMSRFLVISNFFCNRHYMF